MGIKDFYKTGTAGRLKHQTYTVVTTTISANEAGGETVISVTSTTGMSATVGRNNVRIQLDTLAWHQTTISSIGAGTITIAVALPSAAASGKSVVVDGNYTFTIPGQAVQSGMLFATYCGGGQSGGGGHVTGGGGGGGGASSTFRDMPVYISGAGTLTVVVGIGAAGGAVGANGKAGGITRIETNSASVTYSLPTGRGARATNSLAVAGAATNGGKGGDGGPMVTVPEIAATSTTGVEGGPLGGAAGTAGVNGGAGAAASRRGYSGTTGGAGGGGGSTTSLGGSGGADEKHGDQNSNGNGSGGAGGGSFFGGAGAGGDPASDATGISGNGPGSGGGGGGTNGWGGNGGEGIVIFRWM